MDDVTRRQAMKLAAVTGAAAAAIVATGGEVSAQEHKKGQKVGDGVPVTRLGSQESYQLSKDGQSFTGTYSDNCDDVKDDLRRGYDCAEFGSCDDFPDPASADAYAFAYLVPKILSQGCVRDTEAGHKTIDHSTGGTFPIHYHTYLPYARGRRP